MFAYEVVRLCGGQEIHRNELRPLVQELEERMLAVRARFPQMTGPVE